MEDFTSDGTSSSKVPNRLNIHLIHGGGSPGELSEKLVTSEKRKKGRRMKCDVGEATEGLENEL